MIFQKDIPEFDYNGEADRLYENARIDDGTVVVILDDDPTGTQTVHDVNVYTDFEGETILRAFRENDKQFFILTNSRSFPAYYTAEVHKKIAERIKIAARKTGKKFIIISRGDSTLRGNWPIETKVLADNCGEKIDGEILIPFFKEGGRFTFGDNHYVRTGRLIFPVAETEFAKDPTFGFKSSNLKEYIEEKTEGAVKASEVISISLETLNSCDVDGITQSLLQAENGTKIIVNAVSYDDLKIFFCAYVNAIRSGKKYIFRTAASWVKICIKNSRRSLIDNLKRYESNDNGGIIIVGSHVDKTTKQLEYMKSSRLPVEYIRFSVNYFADMSAEAAIVSAKATDLIKQRKTVCVYTSRQVVGADNPDKDERLRFSLKVSYFLTSIVANLKCDPSFVITKGGITSSDIGVKALGIKKAEAIGQLMPGIPVWLTEDNTRFGKMPFVIFPGNVGEEDSLYQAVRKILNLKEISHEKIY